MGLLAWVKKRRKTRGASASPLAARVEEAQGSAPWSAALANAERLWARGDSAAAAEALSCEIGRVRQASASTQALLATALAHLGRARSALNDFGGAIEATREALEIWRANGDQEGVRSALANLVELERRGGSPTAAAAHARELASEYNQAGDGEGAYRYRELARALLHEPDDRKIR
jgi:tetratricopeptide (TPR) repeat protein